MFGGRANAAVSMNGDDADVRQPPLTELYVSFQATLSQDQRDAMESFLTAALQDVLANAINNGLPAFPIPSFTLPASVAQYGLPAGAELGIVNPVLSTVERTRRPRRPVRSPLMRTLALCLLVRCLRWPAEPPEPGDAHALGHVAVAG